MIAWVCQECGDPIEGNNGWVYLPFVSHTPVVVVPWRIRHGVCVPPEGITERSYRLEVGDLRTWASLVHWTTHLMSKRWFGNTNWFDVVRPKVDAAERHSRVEDPTTREGQAWVRMMDVVGIARNWPDPADFRDWVHGSRRFLDAHRVVA